MGSNLRFQAGEFSEFEDRESAACDSKRSPVEVGRGWESMARGYRKSVVKYAPASKDWGSGTQKLRNLQH
jgi:hypothetical protein